MALAAGSPDAHRDGVPVSTPPLPRLRIESSGRRYSPVPPDAAVVIDVRAIPNPADDPVLCHLTGLDAAVRSAVFAHSMTEDILASLIILTGIALAAARDRGEPDVLVCVRCTGGKHRSVAIAAELETEMAQNFPNLSVTTCHRDLTSGRKATPPAGDLDTQP